MGEKIEKLLSYCCEIDFGVVTLSEGEKEFLNGLNDEIILLCKSLPESTQTGALFFLMRYFRIPFGKKFSIFMKYYVPAWSVVYWIIQSGPKDIDLKAEDRERAITAHSMALLLHPLDDHLNDGQLQATHLVLLLRSQVWMIMNKALKRLADGIDGGREIVKELLNQYYSGVSSSEQIRTLDEYSNLFRKQMASWLIVPNLLMKSIHNDSRFTEGIKSAYESFGIAWRLLDDINDIETDMKKGVHSSVYICLPESLRDYWDKDTEERNNGGDEVILNYVLENDVIDQIKGRISSELESAASITKCYNMRDLSNQFLCLLNPLINDRESL